MNDVLRKFIQAVLLILAIIFVFGCAKSSQEGTQAGGGGFVKVSSEEEVKSILALALKLAGEPDPRRNIIVEYWKSRARDGTVLEVKNPESLFPSALNTLLLDEVRFESPALKAIAKKKLQLLDSGNCLIGMGESNSDASVSAYNVDAEVCFSIGNLRRIPPNDLLRHILALVLHEANHLGGAGEVVARAWQDDFEKYFGYRFGDISKGAVSIATREGIVQARASLEKALIIASQNPSDPQIYNYVGRFSEGISRLPDISDEVALEIKLKPRKPELVGNYVNAVLALLEKVQVKFETRPQVIHAGPFPVPISFMSPELIYPALVDIQKNLDVIEGNFKAFMDDSMAPYSRCILPEGSLDPSLLIPVENKRALVLPPRKCQILEFKSFDN